MHRKQPIPITRNQPLPLILLIQVQEQTQIHPIPRQLSPIQQLIHLRTWCLNHPPTHQCLILVDKIILNLIAINFLGFQSPYPNSYSSDSASPYATPMPTAMPQQNNNYSYGTGTIQPTHIRASLLSAVEDRIRQKLRDKIGYFRNKFVFI